MAKITWNAPEGSNENKFNAFGREWKNGRAEDVEDLWVITEAMKNAEFTVTGAPTVSPGVNAIVPPSPHQEMPSPAATKKEESPKKDEPKKNEPKNETHKSAQSAHSAHKVK